MRDIVVWKTVNVTTSGVEGQLVNGELVPDATTTAETAERDILRAGGAIRACTSYAAEVNWDAAIKAACTAEALRRAADLGVAYANTLQVQVAGYLYVLEPPV